ncbi:MAG: hypothetical protein ACLP01_16445 [Solirubrobacteraceae bacterium]
MFAALLPEDATVGICASCHEARTSEPHKFIERSGVFPRPTPPAADGFFSFGSGRGVYTTPIPRTEMVPCTDTELMWTRSHPIIEQDGRASHDAVTLCSAPFAQILGSAVRDRHKGEIDVWSMDGPTLAISTTPDEVDELCAHIDQQATSQ